MKISKNCFFYFLTTIVVFSGLFLRTYIWKNCGCFWADEGCLLNNIVNKNFGELFLPLSFVQCCPPLFSIIGKIFYHVLGLNYKILKIYPFIASCLSLLFFSYLSSKFLKNKIAIIIAVFLFALHQELLYLSQLFKQYSTDVLITILIILIIMKIKEVVPLCPKKWFLISVLSIVFMLFSYPAIFLIYIVTLIYIIYLVQKKNHKDLKDFNCFIFPFFIFSLFYFFFNCLPAIKNPELQLYWHNQELFFPNSISLIKTFLGYVIGIYDIKITLISILVSIGLYRIFKEDKFLFSVFVLTILNSIIFGYFNLYPLTHSRVDAYLIPIFILIISKSLDSITIKNKIFSMLIIILFAISMSYKEMYYNVKNVFTQKTTFKQSNSQYFMDKLYLSDVQQSDFIYTDITSQVILELLDTEKRYNNNQFIYKGRGKTIEETLNEIPDEKNIFFFISNDYFFDNQYEIFNNWIYRNCKIIYNEKNEHGNFIKCRKNK